MKTVKIFDKYLFATSFYSGFIISCCFQWQFNLVLNGMRHNKIYLLWVSLIHSFFSIQTNYTVCCILPQLLYPHKGRGCLVDLMCEILCTTYFSWYYVAVISLWKRRLVSSIYYSFGWKFRTIIKFAEKEYTHCHYLSWVGVAK